MKPWWKRGLPGWFSFGTGGGATVTPLTYFSYSQAPGGRNPGGVNNINGSGFVLPYALTFSTLGFTVNVADGVNLYDVGVYSPGGVLIADIGAQTLPSATFQAIPTLQGTQTIQAGLYIWTFTGNANTAEIGSNNFEWAWLTTTAIGTSSGGALPASIGPVSFSQGLTTFAVVMF